MFFCDDKKTCMRINQWLLIVMLGGVSRRIMIIHHWHLVAVMILRKKSIHRLFFSLWNIVSLSVCSENKYFWNQKINLFIYSISDGDPHPQFWRVLLKIHILQLWRVPSSIKTTTLNNKYSRNICTRKLTWWGHRKSQGGDGW